TINADQVRVRGFTVVGGEAPGIWMKGTGITVENNTVRHPTGDDFDGIRFFGTDLKILHNTISDISLGDGGGSVDCIQSYSLDSTIPDPTGMTVTHRPHSSDCDPEPDCMQTFATGPKSSVPNTGTSQRVLIEANRCQRILDHCLIVQGPHS